MTEKSPSDICIYNLCLTLPESLFCSRKNRRSAVKEVCLTAILQKNAGK